MKVSVKSGEGQRLFGGGGATLETGKNAIMERACAKKIIPQATSDKIKDQIVAKQE